jgi:hypothetical protein
MKKNILIFSLLFLTFILNGCFGYCDDCNQNIQKDPYKAVILERNVFEASVKTFANQEIVKSGKIYIKDNLMFVNDLNKGFHVYNYFNPQSPIKIGFIQILGATDLSIRDNVIYINQAVDLVTLTYNPANNSIVVNHRNKNVFPQKNSPNGTFPDVNQNQIVVDWQL